MSIIGSLPIQLANNTLADATQVMSDLNAIVTAVNTNAAAVSGGNAFTGAQTIGGDVVTTNFATQTLTNKTLTSPTLNAYSAPLQPAVDAMRITAAQAIPGSSGTTTLVFNSEITDQGSNYNPASGFFTAVVAGFYLFSGAVSMQNNSASTVTISSLYLLTPTGSRLLSIGTNIPLVLNGGGSAFTLAIGPVMLAVTAGGSVAVQINTSGAGTLSLLTGSYFGAYQLA